MASVTVVGLLAACRGSISLGNVPPENTTDGGPDATVIADAANGAPSGSYGITCTLYHRPSPSADFEQQAFKARSDATAAQTFTFSNATIDVALAPAPDAPADALLTVGVREKFTTQVYRVAKATPPVAQFAGGHGFSGLVYIGDDLQYICEAENAPTPVVEPYVVPLDVVCQVEVRTTPGGPVELSQLFEFLPNVDGSTPTQQQSLLSDGVTVDISVTDSSFESNRTVHTSIQYIGSPATGPAAETAVAQLFQLDRFAGVVNQLANTTFTGRASLSTSIFKNDTNKEVSYACASRQGGGATALDPSDAGVLPDGASLNPLGSLKPCGYPTAASPSCSPCDSQEFCFTQVSCGYPLGSPCTVGSTKPADNRCHKSCQTDDQCGPYGECVTIPYFACGSMELAGGRSICCTKGTNCQ